MIRRAPVLAAVLVSTACQTHAVPGRPIARVTSPPIAPRPDTSDPVVQAVASARAHGCSDAAVVHLGPRSSSSGVMDARRSDVLVFTAHPDDEAMYAGGTLRRLAEAHRSVSLMPLSHGEGGRLLEPAPDGGFVERRDLPVERVVAVRDAEIAAAARVEHVALDFVRPFTAGVDYGFTTSCDETLAHWDDHLDGGLAGLVRSMATAIRARLPHVVLTLDPRDDPQASGHGHHKATGVLAIVAARLAADPRVTGGGAPWTVDAVYSFAPAGVAPDETVGVDPSARLAALRAYPSQFRPVDLQAPVALRPTEGFVLRSAASDRPATLFTRMIQGPGALE